MHWFSLTLESIGVFCLATQIWYLPYRRVSEHFGFHRTKSGRVRRATLIELLNAFGCLWFVAAILMNLAKWLGDSAR